MGHRGLFLAAEYITLGLLKAERGHRQARPPWRAWTAGGSGDPPTAD